MEAFNLIQGSKEWHDFRKANLQQGEVTSDLCVVIYGIRISCGLALHSPAL